MTYWEERVARDLGIPEQHVCTVGSTLICGKGNDVDLLCLVPSDDCLERAGFSPDAELRYESALHSWRRGEVNVIAVHDRAFFLAEVAIAHAAKAIREKTFDMRERDDRVSFHSIVRDAVLQRAEDPLFDDLLL